MEGRPERAPKSPVLPPTHLEVEDAGVVLLEALPVGHHAVQELLVEREGADGSQQPAVAWARRGKWRGKRREPSPGGGGGSFSLHTSRGVSGCPAPAPQLAVWVSNLSGVSTSNPFPCHTASFGSEPRS